MAQAQQPTRGSQSIYVTAPRVGEKCQGMPPKTKHIIMVPDEMHKVDSAGYVTKDRVNADACYYHSLISPLDVVLTDIHVIHVTQESKAKRTYIENECRVINNLED
jgi:hypothetical protein